jgi:hypothetical protein
MVSSLNISTAAAAQQQSQQVSNPFRQDQNDPTKSLRDSQQTGQQQTGVNTTNSASATVQTQSADTQNQNRQSQQLAASSQGQAESTRNTGQERGSVLDISV